MVVEGLEVAVDVVPVLVVLAVGVVVLEIAVVDVVLVVGKAAGF